MKSLIWDYKSKKLLDPQNLKLDINLNNHPVAFGVNAHVASFRSDFCQLEFDLDYSYFDWVQEWLHSQQALARTSFKRDLHLNNDIIFIGCIPKLINLDYGNKIELIIQCDHYQSSPFSKILEVHRDLMINEILSS